MSTLHPAFEGLSASGGVINHVLTFGNGEDDILFSTSLFGTKWHVNIIWTGNEPVMKWFAITFHHFDVAAATL